MLGRDLPTTETLTVPVYISIWKEDIQKTYSITSSAPRINIFILFLRIIIEVCSRKQLAGCVKSCQRSYTNLDCVGPRRTFPIVRDGIGLEDEKDKYQALTAAVKCTVYTYIRTELSEAALPIEVGRKKKGPS
jgi:hypothetical protein